MKLLIALEALTLVTCSLALAGDPANSPSNSVFVISDQCRSGDPLCVEKRLITPVASPGPTNAPKAPSPAAGKSAKTPSAHSPRAHGVQPPSVRRTEPNRPSSGVQPHAAPGGYGYTFEQDSVEGSLNPKDFNLAAGPRPKIILSDELECQLPQEVTDSYSFDRSRCAKLNQPVVEAGRVLGGQLAEEFARTGECPKSFNDIEKLKALELEFKKNPFVFEPKELISAPIDEENPKLESHLPFSCGYNSGHKAWFQKVSIYFTTPNSLHQQVQGSSPKNGYSYQRIDQSYLFRQVGHTYNGKSSYRDGGDAGDLLLVPLGHGVYFQVIQDQRGSFYWGLVFAPSAARFQMQACKKARWLNKNEDLVTAQDRAAGQAEIRNLLMRGEALERVKKITFALKKADSDEMPADIRSRLTTEAKELLDVLDGKSEIKDFKIGELHCPNS